MTPNPAALPDKPWRVFRFEREDGKYCELASNEVGPNQIPVPPGYRFMRATNLVPEAEALRLRADVKRTTTTLMLVRDCVDALRFWEPHTPQHKAALRRLQEVAS
jgi:hypothetical protein